MDWWRHRRVPGARSGDLWFEIEWALNGNESGNRFSSAVFAQLPLGKASILYLNRTRNKTNDVRPTPTARVDRALFCACQPV